MQFLIANGAKIDLQNNYGETALHTAIRGGNFPAIELLLRKKARVDLVSREGTAIELAQRILDPDTFTKIEELASRLKFSDSAIKSVVDYNSLPKQAKDMANVADLSSQVIDQNFEVFADIIRFVSKDKIIPNRKERYQVTFEKGDPNAIYKVESTVTGSGGYGSVFIARNIKTKQLVAVKKTENKSIKDFKRNTNELCLLKACQHQNVVRFIEAYNLTDLHEIWAVMEYMEGGTLHSLINKGKKLKESHIAYIVKDVLEGLKKIHSLFIAHRDIKSHNIMLTMMGDVKLVDFGFAVDLREEGGRKVVGTSFWMAPEIIRREPISVAVDVWSLGITVMEMVNGEPPNSENAVKAMFLAATGATKPQFRDPGICSSELVDFVDCCLQSNPTKRKTCEELLQHPFIQTACSRDSMKEIIGKVFIKESFGGMGIGF